MRLRPYIDTAYERDLRLLVTSSCSHRCPFCHNEGQGRQAHQSLSPDRLRPYLEILRDFSGSITLSGGEPLQSPAIEELVDLLWEANFDITLVTAGAELARKRGLLGHIKSLHVSIISLDSGEPLSSCNGLFEEKVEELLLIRSLYPLLAICINIPYVRPRDQVNALDRFLGLAKVLDAKLKFIFEFPLQRAARARGADWAHRWGSLAAELRRNGFVAVDSNIREVEFASDSGAVVELSEIGCVAVDEIYSCGRCFDSMDVTINPDLTITLCRWQANAIDLNAVLASGKALIEFLGALVSADTDGCPYETGTHALVQFDSGLQRFIFDDHYRWPSSLVKAELGVVELVRRREYSLPGTQGIVGRFEREFASYHASPYALATASGTVALFLAFAALGFDCESEVVVPIYSYPGTVTPLVLLGAKIVWCDVSPVTGNIDVESLRRAVGPRTRGVVVTHMWGQPVELAGVMQVCEENGLALVEDCSHAVGAEYQGRKVGTFGAFGCFSLQANKAVCAGEGGVLITSDQSLFEDALLSGSLKQVVLDSVRTQERRKYWETGLGLKVKLHPLGAALALGYLRNIDQRNEQRMRGAERLAIALADCPVIVPRLSGPGERRVYYKHKVVLSDLLADDRDLILEQLILAGLRIGRTDLRPLSMTELFKDGARSGDAEVKYPGATRYCSRLISLPALGDGDEHLTEFYLHTLRKVLGQRASEARLEGKGGQIL
jgi:perosamine synthetase